MFLRSHVVIRANSLFGRLLRPSAYGLRVIFFALICVAAMRHHAGASPVDPSTLNGKMVMGYQGWFSCPGDSAGRGWVHWKNAQQDVTVDFLPDVRELQPSELCDAGMTAANGKPVSFFTDQNPDTVDRHFAWMENYNIDGVALQKFATLLLHPELEKGSDIVAANVRRSAERHGRIFFIMYDLSGMPPEQLNLVVEDWSRFIREGLSSSPAYVKHKGRPVLGLWGIGFSGRPLSPAITEAFLTQLRAVSGAAGGVTILGGVPAYWRDGRGDGSPDPGWKDIWPKLDIISPWTVGRYADDAGADNYLTQTLTLDIAKTKEMAVDYMPVIFPGFSSANVRQAKHEADRAILNKIPRRCGAFYWRQAANAIRAGAAMLYTAMFDEVDEGTAMFKLAPSSSDSPKNPSFVTLDADGCHIPSDWYLQLGGAASNALKNRTVSPDLPLRLPH